MGKLDPKDTARILWSPCDYKHIAAWGDYLGSFAYYVRAQQEKASRDNAPRDATFQREDGTWARIVDAHPDTILSMRSTLERHGLWEAEAERCWPTKEAR